jgi:hypothetical protein
MVLNFVSIIQISLFSIVAFSSIDFFVYFIPILRAYTNINTLFFRGVLYQSWNLEPLAC